MLGLSWTEIAIITGILIIAFLVPRSLKVSTRLIHSSLLILFFLLWNNSRIRQELAQQRIDMAHKILVDSGLTRSQTATISDIAGAQADAKVAASQFQIILLFLVISIIGLQLNELRNAVK